MNSRSVKEFGDRNIANVVVERLKEEISNLSKRVVLFLLNA